MMESAALPIASEDLQGLQDLIAELSTSSTATELAYESNLRSAWNAVKHQSLVICSDVFDKIDREDIIEIWDLTGRQLYRSFHALRYFSYTLEELTMYPFYELFERDAEIEEAYTREFVRVVSGAVTGTYKLDIPTHIVREKRSLRRNVSLVTPKYVSPLKSRSGRLVAFIHTCSAKRRGN